ncbi:ImmA/IrrE family metallo-endopeptidase [Paenibacillus polymyxa]|uniref:ImmA/IrrE family metallo-endopeptidase n=1 Tax=Paenibacillus polymyxa TaxID=1406 RepID=UPI002AB4A6F7|nr:SprT-like domain-containing protein [Paenibacillus polymyxa]MDY8021139.1 SprT-like domain-containing protein [Paenibacillus polymyxa]
MPEVTLEWLNKQAKQLVKNHWGLNEIPRIAIDLERENLDWTKAVGYYCNDIETIAFSSEVNKRRTERAIRRTLLHELCHWYLHTTGQKFRDSDERFARELIRVGLGRRHNQDERATLAAKQARLQKKKEFFELIERCDDEIIVIRMKHHRKNEDDFKKDLASTLIRIHNTREEGGDVYLGDVADKLCEWYGYKTEPIAKFAIEVVDYYSYGVLGDRDKIIELLQQLDVDYDEAESKLDGGENEDLFAASEDTE